MNGFSKFLVATFLSAAMLFSGAAQAMEIQKFDQMALQDQGDYIAVLIDGAQRVLIDEGNADLAAKINKLFTEVPAGDKISLGLNEFERNLDRVRVDDAKNAVLHPNDPRSEVEDAMAITLENNGIELPDSFFTVASNFKPKLPPANEKKEKKN
jgi:hypothetical protein